MSVDIVVVEPNVFCDEAHQDVVTRITCSDITTISTEYRLSTYHIDPNCSVSQSQSVEDVEIVRNAAVMIANVATPSVTTGYLIRLAEEAGVGVILINQTDCTELLSHVAHSEISRIPPRHDKWKSVAQIRRQLHRIFSLRSLNRASKINGWPDAVAHRLIMMHEQTYQNGAVAYRNLGVPATMEDWCELAASIEKTRNSPLNLFNETTQSPLFSLKSDPYDDECDPFAGDV